MRSYMPIQGVGSFALTARRTGFVTKPNPAIASAVASEQARKRLPSTAEGGRPGQESSARCSRRVWDGSGRLRRQERECVHMPRAQEAEVAVVEGRQLRFVQPLDHLEDGGIDEAHVGRCIPITKLPNSAVVRFDQRKAR